jgi:hypothetical protein
LSSRGELSKLDAIERLRHFIDQLPCDIRDVASIDLIVRVFQGHAERREHRRRSSQIPALTLDHIDHFQSKDVLLRPCTSTLAPTLLSPLKLSPSLRTHDRPPQKVGCGSRIAGVTARRCGACDVLRDFE